MDITQKVDDADALSSWRNAIELNVTWQRIIIVIVKVPVVITLTEICGIKNVMIYEHSVFKI